MEQQELIYRIAITRIPGIGNVLAKKIIAYCGSVEGVFREKEKFLTKIPGIGDVLAKHIVSRNSEALDRAEKEIPFIEKYKIEPIFYLDEAFPERLKNCPDSPVMLFKKGDTDLNAPKIISIVGTRKATVYGKKFCDDIIKDLAARHPEVVVISGMAYGIDIAAHKASLTNKIPTIAVLAHGLDRLYPQIHAKQAKEMIASGGSLVTEYLSETNPDPQNFVMRNRIVAGMADATLVIESGIKGGALITAEIAFSYSRDVLAVPGRIGDTYSEGCNWLIKTNRAALVESISDLEYALGWEPAGEKTIRKPQQQLNLTLSEEERKIFDIIKEEREVNIDLIHYRTDIPVSKLAALLLNMEFSGCIRCLPGKMYNIV